MLKKYMITIEEPQSFRYHDFFHRNKFLLTDFSVYGVKGKDACVQDYFLRAVLGASLPLTPSEFGCKESHMHCLTDFLQSEANYAIILEDDVIQKTKIDFDFDFSILGENFIFYIGDMQHKKTKKFRVYPMDVSFSDRSIGRLFLSSPSW
jgi:glycosyl transferase family 25